MASKPTQAGEWASDAGRTLEPSAGEKGTGWQAGYKPPARKMNWLFNIAYQWFQYLSDAIFVADSGSNNDGVNATADGTGDGVVGTASGESNSSAGGVFSGDVSGAATTSNGIEATGAGTDGHGVIGTGAGTGPGVRGVGVSSGYGVEGLGGGSSGVGVHGTGGQSSGSPAGVLGTGGLPNGPGVRGVGAGTGDGVRGESTTAVAVHGVASSSGTGVHGESAGGYGVKAEGDATTPNYAALQVVPQNLEAATPETGSIQIITTNGKMVNYNGQEFERQVPQVHAAVVSEQRTSTGNFTTLQYSIPAGTLRVGSTIRVRMAGAVTTAGTNQTLGVALAGTALSVAVGTVPTGSFAFEAFFTVRALGSGTTEIHGAIHGGVGTSSFAGAAVTAAMDSTAAITVDPRVLSSGGSPDITVTQFQVDVT